MNTILRLLLLGILVCGLPLVGAALCGFPVQPFLEFPPQTIYVVHASFSWPAFWALAVFLIAFIFLIFKLIRVSFEKESDLARRSYPWWGWGGLVLILIGWWLGWTTGKSWWQFQIYSFFIIWMGYILVAQSIVHTYSGNSLLFSNPNVFLLLFPLSACFWWSFEFLNRFVQNWYYLPVKHLTAPEYSIYASLSFSTVLNAVFATKVVLGLSKVRFICKAPKAFHVKSRLTLFFVGSLPLLFLNLLPDTLFPFVWVSPLCFAILLFPQTDLLLSAAKGDLTRIVQWSMAGLICGFFWELWNYGSLFKWQYLIPYVDAFRIFEMPLLGYAGYLPFGVLCGILCEAIARSVKYR